ncbi:Tvp18 protein [Martiniozyma asiatica (nom. inval.)]|nr:Tvp18 protein [Martiniozyma asiatica]
MANITDYVRLTGFLADLQSRNLSLYGQWIGILTIPLTIALGISNLFHVSLVFIFGIIAIVQCPIVAVVEIPFLLKIFRIPDAVILFVQGLDTNWRRVLFYAVMCAIQWISLSLMATSLLVLAILWSICMISYAAAAILGQEFHKSNVVATVSVGETPAEAQIRDVL